MQNQIQQVIEEKPNQIVAELFVFKAKIEIALFKPQNALETLEAANKLRAEPLEMIRDCYNLLLQNLDSPKKPIVLRKPKHDIYSKSYIEDL